MKGTRRRALVQKPIPVMSYSPKRSVADSQMKFSKKDRGCKIPREYRQLAPNPGPEPEEPHFSTLPPRLRVYRQDREWAEM